jgi:type I restriction enzyme S subunit
MAEWKETELGQMPADWDLKTIDEVKSIERKSIISGPFGSNISSKFFVPNGIPVIRGNNLSLNISKRFIDDGFVFLTPDKANELGTWATKDDLIFTAAGTIGQVGILTGSEKYSKYIISNKQLRVRLDRTIVEPLFAYYWFASPFMIDTINSRDTGSTIPLINLSVLKGLLIPVPPLPEQQAIVEVLSGLDDKIDLLHRQNKTLEALAETLFRQWFVEGAEESWDTISLSDIANHIKDNINPSQQPEKVFKHYSLPAFDEGKEPKLEIGESILSNKFKVCSNSILISKLNPRTPRVWPLYGSVDEEISICSTEFQIVKPKKISHFGFVYYFLKSFQVTHELANAAGGTSGSHQRINPDDIFNLSLLLPSADKLEKFDLITRDSLKKINKSKIQIRALTKLRDTLLSKLMSGEVRVKIDGAETATAKQ